MQKILFFLFVMISFGVQGQVAEADKFFPIETSHSYVEFSVKYMGYAKVKGRFADFSGMIYYDDKNLAKMSASLTIKVESVDTDLEFRDNDLKSENWFDAKKFPLITFVSKKLTPTPGGFDVTGDLTMKDVTKEIVVHMGKASGVLKDIRNDAQVILTGTTRINRIDFGVEGKNWSGIKEGITAVENDIDVEISLLAKQIKKDNFKNWVSNPETAPTMIYKAASSQNVAAAKAEFEKLKVDRKLTENSLITVGYMLQLEGKMHDAIMILEENAKAFPESSRAYQELGLAYLRAGHKSKAKENLQIAVQKDPPNAQAGEVLRHL
jgi:polyisoprenoid-binding protein YceI